MCVHLWKIGPTKHGRAVQRCQYCKATETIDTSWKPLYVSDRHIPKMSQVDKDVGAIFAGCPSQGWYL